MLTQGGNVVKQGKRSAQKLLTCDMNVSNRPSDHSNKVSQANLNTDKSTDRVAEISLEGMLQN